MADLGELKARLTADHKRLMSDLNKGKRLFKDYEKDSVRSIGAVEKSLGGLKSAIAGIAVTAGVLQVSKSFLNAARTSENYQIRLKALLGSVEQGNRMFKEMAQFASKVPFEYEKIMGSATALSGVMKGGVEEVKRWMPIIADLAAVSGLSVEETTSQIIRMYSAGAAAADMFRERGILAMLGFKADASYSAEETQARVIAAWEDTNSKFRGATNDMAKTWDGLMSMIGDKWFQLRNRVMSAGVYDYLKKQLETVDKTFGEWLRKNEQLIAEKVPEYVEQLASAFETFALAVKGLYTVLKPVVWLLMQLKDATGIGMFIKLLKEMGIARQKIQGDQSDLWLGVKALFKGGTRAGMAKELEQLKLVREYGGQGGYFSGVQTSESAFGLPTAPKLKPPGGVGASALEKQKSQAQKHADFMAKLEADLQAQELQLLEDRMRESDRLVAEQERKSEESKAREVERLQQLGKQWEVSMRTPMEELIARQQEVEELWQAEAISAETYQRALASINTEMEGLRNKEEELSGLSTGIWGDMKSMVGAFLMDSQTGFANWEQILSNHIERMASKFIDSMLEIAFSAENLKMILNSLKSLINSISSTNISSDSLNVSSGAFAGTTESIANSILSGIGNVALTHTGGTIGYKAATRMVDPSVFLNAPRYHPLKSNERAIIGEVGETVTPRGYQFPSPTFNVNIYTGGQQAQTRQRDNSTGGQDFDVMIDSVMARNVNRGGQFAQALDSRYQLAQAPVGR